MDKFSLAGVLIIGSLMAFTDAPEQIRTVIDESIRTGQQLATAGDLRSMSTMLDAHFFKHGRYPRADRFATWLAANFKENHVKDLAKDHWGNSYLYTDNQGRSYILSSLGEDGLPGTEDDMTVTGP
ncbi:type II secretion system protein GspG [Desulfobulbus rhabdoformis]|jgi:general secretion pathway protein G|uniref:type II secretion system protein GspG n=1 Tax=Desulfobulbus rhabdoformis TaxID=34032 RepID=UPI0019627EF1|nr:type II secretion system protein GspG [Desulfobulbus rhabdoformis]MBM9612847.1 type II secretion system protein GspG [Desulfobulbus rhabdoformis]